MTDSERTTRDRILDEATRLFHTRGFKGTSIGDLLSAAGVTKGSLYFHFAGKHDLGLRVLTRARERFLTFIRESLAGDTPRERLHRFFDAAVSTHNRTGFVGGCLWGNTALEMSDTDPDYVSVVSGVFDEWTRLIAEVVAEGQERGEFRNDIPADLLASNIVAALEGGIMQSRLKKTREPMENCIESLKRMVAPAGGAGRAGKTAKRRSKKR